MLTRVEILDRTLNRLQEVSSENCGKLFGVLHNGTAIILEFGLNVSPSTDTSFSHCAASFYQFPDIIYPAGVDCCGLLSVNDVNPIIDVKNLDCSITSKLKNISVSHNAIYLQKQTESNEIECYCLERDQLTKTNFSVLSYTEFKEKFVYLLVSGYSTITLPKLLPSSQIESVIMKEISRKISSVAFQFGETNEYLCKFNLGDSTIGDKWGELEKHKDILTDLEVLEMQAMFLGSYPSKKKNTVFAAQIIDYSKPLISQTEGQLPYIESQQKLVFDGLCVVNRDTSLSDVYQILTASLKKIIFLPHSYMAKNIEHVKTIGLHSVHHHQFFSHLLGVPVSYLAGQYDADKDLVDLRRGIHLALNIPLERPHFTKQSSLSFLPSHKTTYPLLNVHIGLKPSGIKSSNSKVALVNGHYHYYHYLMDGMKDSGWGCAYRSLQTVFSWFRLQGYTTETVPNHEKIQETLVKIGDKPSSFKGSTKWIGSTEVAFVLETLISVSSCIVNVPSGGEMNTVGIVLLEHFSTHGTPVMIGGGVLAHTILGVDFDEDSNEIKFLILDPHYTGEDVLQKVQKKGGVGWKGMEFWDKKSFYNLCMPQRPIMY